MVIHTKAVDNVKKLIFFPQILTSYTLELPIAFGVIQSKDDIGFCMMQKDNPLHFNSRSMNEAEINYAQIEK